METTDFMFQNIGEMKLLTLFRCALNLGIFSSVRANFFLSLNFQSFSSFRPPMTHFRRTKSFWIKSVMIEATPLSSVSPFNSISTSRIRSMIFSTVQKSPQNLKTFLLVRVAPIFQSWRPRAPDNFPTGWTPKEHFLLKKLLDQTKLK